MANTRTKQLARKLGLIQSKKRKPAEQQLEEAETGDTRKRRKRNGQLLSYLIVIDFESTCWENKKGFQEIIEFPAVLLDLQTGKIVDEFQQYVLPRDNPKLSDFCKTLTGISQEQVDNGVPLATCVYLFGCWMKKIKEERGVVIMEPGKEYSQEMSLCALVTWSDWDLEVCLNYECRRKQIRKPSYFNQWIDIRATYKKFYDQRPSGLSGAMEDLGIVFTGRQHSGIDDARNTAKLCYRMVRDGCRLDITKCIQTQANPGIVRPPASTVCTSTEQYSAKPAVLTKGSSQLTEQENAPSNCRDKLHIIDNITSTKSSMTATVSPVSVDNAGCMGIPKATDDKNKLNKSSKNELEFSNNSKKEVAGDIEDDWTNFDEGLMKDIARELDEWDTNDSTSTAQLRTNQPITTHKIHHMDSHTVSRPSTCSGTLNACAALIKCQPLQDNARLMGGTPSRPDFVSHVSPVTLLSYPRHGGGKKSTQLPSPLACSTSSKVQCDSTSVEVCVVEETPPHSAENHQHRVTHQLNSDSITHLSHQQTRSVSNYNHIRASTPINSSPINTTPQSSPCYSKRSLPATAVQSICETSNSALSFRTPSTSEWMKVKRLSSGSTHTPSSNLSGELLSSGGKVTPPLCNCGKRTKRRTASNPGPNEGRTFYACPNGKASDKSRGCGFFKWEKMLASSSSSSCSPTAFASSHSHLHTMSCNMLEPEYFESKR